MTTNYYEGMGRDELVLRLRAVTTQRDELQALVDEYRAHPLVTLSSDVTDEERARFLADLRALGHHVD